MKFADPKNDLAFKKIFGNENKKEILISFLNAILGFEGNKAIKEVKIVNPYQVPKIEELKETILDIKAKNKDNEEFIVEMQKKDLGDFPKRSLYYTSKAYVNQLDKSENYHKLKKVYFIGILNFNIFENKKYISRHLILNLETQKQDLKDFEFTFIELPKFNKSLEEIDDNSIIDKWIYFLKETPNLTMIPKKLESPKEIKEAFDIATQVVWDKKELEVYEYIEKKERDERNYVHTQITRAVKKAEKKAIEKGKEVGLKEGLEKGIQKGKKETKIEIVKKLLKQGLDNQTISLITELSIEEINNIKE